MREAARKARKGSRDEDQKEAIPLNFNGLFQLERTGVTFDVVNKIFSRVSDNSICGLLSALWVVSCGRADSLKPPSVT